MPKEVVVRAAHTPSRSQRGAAFLGAIVAAEQAFDLALEHEDRHGAFTIVPHSAEAVAWLLEAREVGLASADWPVAGSAIERLVLALCECPVVNGTWGLTADGIAVHEPGVHSDYCPATKFLDALPAIRAEIAESAADAP